MKAEIVFEAGQHSRQVIYWCLVIISTIWLVFGSYEYDSQLRLLPSVRLS